MEEKILIKSDRLNAKVVFGFFAMLAVIAFLGGYVDRLIWEYDYYQGAFRDEYNSFFEFMTKSRYFNWGIHGATMVGLLVAVGVVLLGIIAYYAVSKVELVVTDKRVYGRVAFGKQVDLPIDSVSSVKLSSFKGIAIGTSSGLISFWRIKNRDAIHAVLSNLLIERQNKVAATPVIKQEIPQSNADELKKFKELLDSGIITQEEFDAKKKQLLGL